METTQLFTYDSLNRLATAETLHQNQPWWQGDPPLANCWGEQFNYDPWGNLLGISPASSAYTGCTQENWSMTATAKNQLQDTNNDYVYDAAGNLIQPGPIGGPYVFDAENHLISAGGMAYLYDGDGKRVGKAPASTPTQPNYLYWYGTGSDPLEETDGVGNYLYRDFRFNGMLLARGEDDWVDHFFLDALGNARCVYGDGDPDGGCSDYYPFGGERPISYGGVNVPFKFTGKERDSESGLDNFGERYFTSSMGRFMRPDPSSVDADVVDRENPQGWNMYSYVLSNPTTAVDPDGLDCIYINNDTGKYEGFNSGDCDNSTEEKANTGYYVNGTVNTITTTTGDANGVVTGYSGIGDTPGTLISGTFNSSSPQTNSNSDALNPFAQGVFTQLNQMNIMNNTLKIYGASAVIGITGGVACYYLCPEAGITTLGLEGAGEAGATPGQAASISRTAAQAGRKGVERALRSYQKRLAEHLAKLNEIKGDPGSVQREINNFRGLIKAAEEYLSKNP